MKILKITLCILLAVIMCGLASCGAANSKEENTTEVTSSQIDKVTDMFNSEKVIEEVMSRISLGMSIEEMDEILYDIGFGNYSRVGNTYNVVWAYYEFKVSVRASYEVDENDKKEVTSVTISDGTVEQSDNVWERRWELKEKYPVQENKNHDEAERILNEHLIPKLRIGMTYNEIAELIGQTPTVVSFRSTYEWDLDRPMYKLGIENSLEGYYLTVTDRGDGAIWMEISKSTIKGRQTIWQITSRYDER